MYEPQLYLLASLAVLSAPIIPGLIVFIVVKREERAKRDEPKAPGGES
jgi:hypothetical protein